MMWLRSKKNNTTKFKCCQKGAILPLFAIGLAALLGLAGLAIDTSHSFVNVTRLQNALDAAALSAARTLNQNAGNESLATQDGTTTFNQHLEGELTSAINITFSYSEKLMPFVATANASRYVRATANNHTIPVWLARVLPGVGATATIGTTAVSGPIPVGTGNGEVCDIAPLIVCGDPTETTQGDDTLFGLPQGELFCLKASSSTGGNGNGNGNGGNGGNGNGNGNQGPPGECQEPADIIGPGNFQLIELDCGPGGSCVRDNLAGAFPGCLTNSGTVTTAPGNTVGPTAQGFNTRFGIYQGPVNRTDFPPDVFTGAPMTFAEYQQKLANGDPPDHADGVTGRRVMSVPIGDCSVTTNGRGTITVLAFGCFFMREPTVGNGQDNWIIGELVDQCEASGASQFQPMVTDESESTFRIILYNDAGNLAS